MTERRRRSIRLPGYDYASLGAYFVTVCAHDRKCIFDVQGLSDVVEETWRWIPVHFPNAMTDEFVVMPNHVHGILWIRKVDVAGARHASPLQGSAGPHGPAAGSLGAMVGSFKSAAARRINADRGTSGVPVWQRNYYERVIRDEDELERIREYIRLNPLRWDLDRENPHRVVSGEWEREWGWLEGGRTVGARHASPLRHVPEGAS